VGRSGRSLGLTILPLSCADCLEILEPHPTETLRVCPEIAVTLLLSEVKP